VTAPVAACACVITTEHILQALLYLEHGAGALANIGVDQATAAEAHITTAVAIAAERASCDKA